MSLTVLDQAHVLQEMDAALGRFFSRVPEVGRYAGNLPTERANVDPLAEQGIADKEAMKRKLKVCVRGTSFLEE